MYLKELANREQEIKSILEDFKNTHQDCLEADDLDEVIEKIDEFQAEKNVALCRNLDKALLKFKNKVLGQIDQFDGQIYDSSMIPIVHKIQMIFREKVKQRMLLELKVKENMRGSLKRSPMLNQNQIGMMPLLDKVGDEDYEYMTYMHYLNTKNNL